MVRNAKVLKLKMLYESATSANYNDPKRRGQIISLPADGDIVVTGDLHGNEPNYAAIIDRADLDSHPKRHLVIQEVTHVLEVGPDSSSEVIAEVARLKVKYPDRVHLLMGNHEMSELTGQEILKGGVCLNILFRQALINKYGEEHADGIRTAMLKFFRSWPLAIRTENRIFICHSTPPAKHIRHYSTRWFRQDTESLWTERNRKMLYLLLWSREYDPKAAKQFAGRVDADVLLVGHKSCPKGWDVPNDTHIIIDCKDHRAHLISFDLTLPYTHEELSQRLERLHPVGTTI